MYALHDAELTVTTLPPPHVAIGPTDQLERRAVEATERGSLTTEDRHNVMYSSAAAVLLLLKGSAEGFAEMLEMVEERESKTAAPGFDTDIDGEVDDREERVDVYA